MRILLASDFFAPHVGGVELQVQALAEALKTAGHDVVVATVRQAGLPARATIGAVDVVRLPGLTTGVPWFFGNPARRYHPPVPDPRIALGIRRLARSFRPDVVQSHGWIAHSCALGLMRTGIPMMLSVRDYGYACATRNLLLDGQICSGPELIKCLRHAGKVYGPAKGAAAVTAVLGLRPWLARRTAVIHAVSSYVASIATRDILQSAARRPVVVIPDIVIEKIASATPAAGGAMTDRASRSDPSSVMPVATGSAPASDPRLPASPYILFVGALQPHKGLGPLIAAHRLLVDPPPLVLIGTRWPDTPTDIPADVTVLSDVGHRTVMEAWDGAVFGVAPSIWPDPLPGVIREAMVRGKPVIGSRAGGISDIIEDGVNGILVPPGDVVELAAAMRRLLDDPELCRRLGERGRADTLAYQAAPIAARFLEAYAAIAGERAVQP
ncbi:MAG: glycosyltransferase family 4 protein [Chloroflexi bacterium]|nr:glycosyltransferase family 4 protein [Chloroflexota bacterium]